MLSAETPAQTMSWPESAYPACPDSSNARIRPCSSAQIMKRMPFWLLRLERFDNNFCVGLTMSLFASIVLLGLEFEDNYLLPFTVLHNF